jgi:Protein of unknown function DUF262
MNDPLARLHRPKADTIEISDLLEEARAGKYELPDFQRDLEWKTEDRVKLFDSIYRGYPIGDILLWEPEEPPGNGAVRFGPFAPLKRQTNPWLIVDGQQRLSTLFGCLLLPDRRDGESSDPYTDWRLAFDVDKKKIVTLHAAKPEFLPLPIAIDTARYLRWARSLPEDRREERTQAGDDFSKALRTYRIPYYVVRTHDPKLLQDVFERVNNTGKPLTTTAVFNALFRSEDQPRLNEIVEELNTAGFGKLESDVLLQAVKVLVGMDPVLDFTTQLRPMDEQDDARNVPGRTRAELSAIHPRLKQAAGAAIDFLKDAGIRRIEALPYPVVLPWLIHFFGSFPGPHTDDVLAKLRAFLWLVVAGGTRKRYRSTYQRAVARLIRVAGNAEKAVSDLVEYSKQNVDDGYEHAAAFWKDHDWRSGATRLVELALFELKPRDLETGDEIQVWDVLPEKGHELFRYIWRSGVDEFMSSSANRLILVGAGRGEVGRILERLDSSLFQKEQLTEILASQAVSPEAWEALIAGRRLEFLRLRAIRITEVVDEFLKKRISYDG